MQFMILKSNYLITSRFPQFILALFQESCKKKITIHSCMFCKTSTCAHLCTSQKLKFKTTFLSAPFRNGVSLFEAIFLCFIVFDYSSSFSLTQFSSTDFTKNAISSIGLYTSCNAFHSFPPLTHSHVFESTEKKTFSRVHMQTDESEWERKYILDACRWIKCYNR
jgi:hypothetical protein